MVATLHHLGVRFREGRPGWQKVSCPSRFHPNGDRNPSASVNLEAGKYECHGCPLRGDGFDLMRSILDLGAREALAVLGLTSEGNGATVSEWIL